MESNPYAPPTSHVADPKSDAHGLKRRSLWLMVVFMVISLGIYYPFWFLRRRAGLNRLDSPQKLPLWPPLLNVVFVGGQFVLALVAGSEQVPEVIGPIGSGLWALLRFGVAVAMIVQCFRIRDIIQDHATPTPDPDQRSVEPVQLSGVMTFFFSIFYLQWAINKYVVGPAKR